MFVLYHRHHLFPRRPASCLPSTELRHRHHPFPTTTPPVLADVCVLSLASCCCSSSSALFYNLTHLSLGIVRESEVRMLPARSFVLYTYCLVFFVVSLFLFSTLLQINTILSTAAMSPGARCICCLFVARGSFLFEVACVNVYFLHRNCAASNTRFLSRCA
jgi:hypothetical protein